MQLLIISIAVIGYLLVILESPLKINKTIISILTGSLCWIVYAFLSPHNTHEITDKLVAHFGEICGLLIFLLGAMAIVEMIELHKGFSVITNRIRTKSIIRLLWIVGGITFFLSSMLDNLATTIIMIMMLKKILPKGNVRMTLVGIVVIAANSGGAFSPIGDVTTTLLWIGGQVSAVGIVHALFVPALISLLVPLTIASFRMKGFAVLKAQVNMRDAIKEEEIRGSKIMLFTGILALLLVPAIKSITGLPPFIGVLFGLGMVALVSIHFHRNKTSDEKHKFSVINALSKVDINSILYFMGILLLVYLLEEISVLSNLATFLETHLPNLDTMVIVIGLLSSIIDNGSLVAATQGMYSLQEFHQDHHLWQFIALSAGIGGSLLVIGSAAGIVAMEKEKISFGWYFKTITPLALSGFIAAVLYELMVSYLGWK